jgi:hypothetical protein
MKHVAVMDMEICSNIFTIEHKIDVEFESNMAYLFV